MKKNLLLASTALIAAGAILGSGSAWAQSTSGPAAPSAAAQVPVPTGPTAETPLVDATQQGVLVFTPDFFADQRPNTALDMVNQLPGFDINDGDGSRGFEGAVGNVLFNGARPASKTDTGSSVLSRTPANQVERIELIRGGAPGIAMQGYAAVVNVILKRETSHQSVVNWSATLVEGARDLFNGSYQYTARDGDRNWSITLADGLSFNNSGGPGRVVRRNAAGTIIRDEAFDQTSFGGGQSARGNWAGPLFGGSAELTGRISQNDFELQQTQSSVTILRQNLITEDSQGGEIGVVYSRPLTDAWKLETRFIHNFSEADTVSANRITTGGVPGPEQRFVADDQSSETIARALFRNERSPSLTFETGGEMAYNVLDTAQAFTNGGVIVPLPSDTVKVEELRGELFGKATWRMSPTFTLESGLRVEASNISQAGDADLEKTLYFAKPRVLATWTPAPGNQFRLRLEREVGQLDFGDFAASADLQNNNVFGGNVDLEPEQRWTIEGFYERRFWGEGVASITVRHQEIDNVLDRLPLSGALSARGNIGAGSQDSISLSLTLPTDRLGVSGGRLRIAPDWFWSEVTDPTTGRSRDISRVRPFDVYVGFNQDIQSWKLQWGVDYLRGFDEPIYNPDEFTNVRVRLYRSAFVEYKPRQDLSLRLEVVNTDSFAFTRTAYLDRSPSRPVAFTEVREQDPRTLWNIRLRKTF